MGDIKDLPEQSKLLEFGNSLRKDFSFDPEWTNLNHGSYGTIPKVVAQARQQYLESSEARPCHFIKFQEAELLDASRAAVAEVLNAPVETIVFVGNATEGVNTVLRNMVWNEDGRDRIISFSTVYDACGRAEDYIADYHKGKVEVHEIQLDYPVEDDEVVRLFEEAVRDLKGADKRPRMCLFDVVSSNPGVVFPWKQMIKACAKHDVLSLVDGAQGIGLVHIDLTANQPDFLVSNTHKWLFSPRGSAVFYVPVRNQHLLPSTLATARGYIPKDGKTSGRTQPLPAEGEKSLFVSNFEWTGTRDDSPFFCVKNAIEWRKEFLGGEQRILEHNTALSKRGIKLIAEILGTIYMDNKTGTLTNCAMGNVALPLWLSTAKDVSEGQTVLSPEEAGKAFHWMVRTMMEEYKTFMAVWVRWGRFWCRISAQVYLEVGDYEFGGRVLREVCERVKNGEYKN